MRALERPLAADLQNGQHVDADHVDEVDDIDPLVGHGVVAPARSEAANVPALLYLHLLDAYGIRIAAIREKLLAELADKEDRRLLALASPNAVLVIREEAYDQAGAVALLREHRATTAHHHYVNEIR